MKAQSREDFQEKAKQLGRQQRNLDTAKRVIGSRDWVHIEKHEP